MQQQKHVNNLCIQLVCSTQACVPIHAELRRLSDISMHAIELERSPTRDEIERKLVRVKNAPRRLMSIVETSPSSWVSDAQADTDIDWRRSMEKNIERIMQHLQIPVVTPMKAANAKTSSSSKSTGSDTSRRPGHIQETVSAPQVLIWPKCVLSSSLHESLDFGFSIVEIWQAHGLRNNCQFELGLY